MTNNKNNNNYGFGPNGFNFDNDILRDVPARHVLKYLVRRRNPKAQFKLFMFRMFVYVIAFEMIFQFIRVFFRSL